MWNSSDACDQHFWTINLDLIFSQKFRSLLSTQMLVIWIKCTLVIGNIQKLNFEQFFQPNEKIWIWNFQTLYQEMGNGVFLRFQTFWSKRFCTFQRYKSVQLCNQSISGCCPPYPTTSQLFSYQSVNHGWGPDFVHSDVGLRDLYCFRRAQCEKWLVWVHDWCNELW